MPESIPIAERDSRERYLDELSAARKTTSSSDCWIMELILTSMRYMKTVKVHWSKTLGEVPLSLECYLKTAVQSLTLHWCGSEL